MSLEATAERKQHMQELPYDDAERLLREHGGYDWLLSGPAFWSVREIAEALKAEGANMGEDAIWRRVKKLPHTQNFGGPVGLKASRRDLVLMFATLMTASTASAEHSADSAPSRERHRGTDRDAARDADVG